VNINIFIVIGDFKIIKLIIFLKKMIMSVGRVCMKVRGKDAGAYCVIVDRVDKKFVLVDGKEMKKRKKVNAMHLEPLPVMLNIKKNSKRETIIKALEKEGF
jgi:large subunit ribosomal protein L14e